MADPHYTATLEVTRTTPAAPVAQPYRDSRSSAPAVTESPREAAQVVRLVLRAPSLEKLQSKLAAHVALIEE